MGPGNPTQMRDFTTLNIKMLAEFMCKILVVKAEPSASAIPCDHVNFRVLITNLETLFYFWGLSHLWLIYLYSFKLEIWVFKRMVNWFVFHHQVLKKMKG